MQDKLKQLWLKLRNSDTIFQTVLGYSLRMAGIFLSFIFTKVVIAVYGIDTWGRFSLSFTYLFLLTVLTKAGFDMALMRFASQWQHKDLRVLRGIYIQSLRFVLPIGLFLSLSLFFCADTLAFWLKKPEMSSDFRWVSLGILPFSLITVHSEGLRGLHQVTFYNFAQTVGNFLITLLLLPIFYYFLGNETQPINIFVLGITLVSLLTAWQWLKSIEIREKAVHYFKFSQIKEVAMPMFLSNIIFVAMGYLDVFILGFYSPEAEIGGYSVASKLSNVLTIPLFAVSGFVAPKITAFYNQHQIKELQQLLLNSSKIVAVTIIPIFIFIAAFPMFLLGLLGINDSQSAEVMIIIAMGYCFNALAGSTDITLQMTGNEKVFRNIAMFSIAINLILNFILIPIYGTIGAAYSNLVTVVLWNLLSIVYARKKVGVDTSFIGYYIHNLIK
ncbi:Membrane protein involved in the export of O-antigen and teichoic acid [Flexibacter flexilis DSM 6793]|uniref:Membrane protein involved in the export of O-antigen and teichoic acid n=1 Tax=Flexibacter flexilis DSM 6793 TaxID=927664 RepID=A0A1I1FLM5_9BACT|nr:flippase [Flexibacter flexilis]SFB98558.1 Membrane protein involved in the export of O-antigen and teichoic acid [Flexibacter flexilis DSM 6793]